MQTKGRNQQPLWLKAARRKRKSHKWEEITTPITWYFNGNCVQMQSLRTVAIQSPALPLLLFVRPFPLGQGSRIEDCCQRIRILLTLRDIYACRTSGIITTNCTGDSASKTNRVWSSERGQHSYLICGRSSKGAVIWLCNFEPVSLHMNMDDTAKLSSTTFLLKIECFFIVRK